MIIAQRILKCLESRLKILREAHKGNRDESQQVPYEYAVLKGGIAAIEVDIDIVKAEIAKGEDDGR